MSAVEDFQCNINRQKVEVSSSEDEIRLLAIIQNDTQKVSLEKRLKNGGKKLVVRRGDVEIGQKHRLN